MKYLINLKIKLIDALKTREATIEHFLYRNGYCFDKRRPLRGL